MSDKTGGPAFPVSTDRPLVAYSFSGMTLRDYFAVKAMHGLIVIKDADPNFQPEQRRKNLAVTAYQMADAMLAERDK